MFYLRVLGVFSLRKIEKGQEFGPFKGRKVLNKNDESVDQRYSWEVCDHCFHGRRLLTCPWEVCDHCFHERRSLTCPCEVCDHCFHGRRSLTCPWEVCNHCFHGKGH